MCLELSDHVYDLTMVQVWTAEFFFSTVFPKTAEFFFLPFTLAPSYDLDMNGLIHHWRAGSCTGTMITLSLSTGLEYHVSLTLTREIQLVPALTHRDFYEGLIA